MRTSSLIVAALLTGLAAGGAMAADKAPMPQTKGMQGMDPAAHEKWAKEGEQDPYKDCKPNAEAARHQEEHGMPDTKGMKGMDPKAHTVDCPEQPVAKAEHRHTHKP